MSETEHFTVPIVLCCWMLGYLTPRPVHHIQTSTKQSLVQSGVKSQNITAWGVKSMNHYFNITPEAMHSTQFYILCTWCSLGSLHWTFFCFISSNLPETIFKKIFLSCIHSSKTNITDDLDVWFQRESFLTKTRNYREHPKRQTKRGERGRQTERWRWGGRREKKNATPLNINLSQWNPVCKHLMIHSSSRHCFVLKLICKNTTNSTNTSTSHSNMANINWLI